MAFSLKNLRKTFNLKTSGRGGAGVVGIDIGSSSIKVIQIKEEHGKVVLETYGELQLGPYAKKEVGRATNLEQGKLTEALVDVVREASVTSRNTALAVPYASSFVTVITLPTKDENQITSMIPIEARKYVPVPVNQVTLDWFTIPDKKGDDGAEDRSKSTRVLLAAIHNEALSKYKSAVGEAGLLSSFTEIEIFSTIRSSMQMQKGAAMIVDIGAATTKLYVVEGGIVQMTHNMTQGGQDLTLSLSRALELSVKEAEELKRQVGLGTDTEDVRIEKAMRFPLERILAETKKVFDRYERVNEVKISNVILSGGGAILRGLPQLVAETLQREVLLADPFSKVEYPAFLDDTLKELGPSFAVSTGIALRRLSEG